MFERNNKKLKWKIEYEYLTYKIYDSANLQRAKQWKEWLGANHSKFGIFGAIIFTAIEDRNMLSISLSIDSELTLGEKELGKELTPLLDGSLN